MLSTASTYSMLMAVAIAGAVVYGKQEDCTKEGGECETSKHISRSLPNWAIAAGKPWPNWKACDTAAAYAEHCNPQPPVCHTEYLCVIRQVSE